METYDDKRINKMTQTSRSISGRRTFIWNEGQTKLQNTDNWDSFRNKGENKTKLINFLWRYFSTQTIRSRFKVKLLSIESINTWGITLSGINMLFTCINMLLICFFSGMNMLFTRIVLHVLRSIKLVIITDADTDVLVLLTCVYPQCNNAKQWLIKTNPGIYVDMKTICNFVGNSIFRILPGFHGVTDCDTTFYPIGAGKITPFNKMCLLSKIHPLQDMGKNIDLFKRLEKPNLFF